MIKFFERKHKARTGHEEFRMLHKFQNQKPPHAKIKTFSKPHIWILFPFGKCTAKTNAIE